jgi:hypothetical protein
MLDPASNWHVGVSLHAGTFPPSTETTEYLAVAWAQALVLVLVGVWAVVLAPDIAGAWALVLDLAVVAVLALALVAAWALVLALALAFVAAWALVLAWRQGRRQGGGAGLRPRCS